MGRRAGIYALALSALCPFTANYAVVSLTESLCLFFTTLALSSMACWTTLARQKHIWNFWLIPLGVAVTFSMLLRADRALLAGVFVVAVAWVCARAGSPSVLKATPVLALAALFLLPLSLWTWRNWEVFHVFQPLSPKYANDPGEDVALGFMRWYRTWGIDYKNTVEVYWRYDGSLVDFDDVPERAFDDAVERAKTQNLIAAYNDATSSTPALDAEFAELARVRIAAHPLRYYVVLPLARLADMWLQPRTELIRMPLDWWRVRRHPGTSAFSFAYVLLNASYLVLACFGFVRWRAHRYSGMPELAWSVIAFLLLRSLLLATLDNAEQRYTIDCYPVILLLASFVFARRTTGAESEQLSC